MSPLDPFYPLLAVLVAFAIGRRGARIEGVATTAPPGTLAEAMTRPGDNFLLIRLVAACAVIYGHSYALSIESGSGGDAVARLGLGHGLYAGSIAVDVFFVVSGFLVAGAWRRRPDLAFFLRSRALRLVPAYAACLVLVAYALGAAMTTLPVADYWRDARVFEYVAANLAFGTRQAWTLPGVFAANPHPDVVNGSLWTLPAEARMYLLVALLGTIGLLRTSRGFALALAGLALAAVGAALWVPRVWRSDYLHLAGLFVAGMGAQVWRARLPFDGRIALAGFGIAALALPTALFPYVWPLVLAYACLWFAYGPKRLLAFNRLGDYSYGVYLWGYPIGQTCAALFPGIGPLALCAASLPLALACGVLSWHLIEKPALRFKQRRAAGAAA